MPALTWRRDAPDTISGETATAGKARETARRKARRDRTPAAAAPVDPLVVAPVASARRVGSALVADTSPSGAPIARWAQDAFVAEISGKRAAQAPRGAARVARLKAEEGRAYPVALRWERVSVEPPVDRRHPPRVDKQGARTHVASADLKRR